MTVPIISENAEEQEPSFIASGKAKWYSHLEDSLVGS